VGGGGGKAERSLSKDQGVLVHPTSTHGSTNRQSCQVVCRGTRARCGGSVDAR
jgi:hypothetical protein